MDKNTNFKIFIGIAGAISLFIFVYFVVIWSDLSGDNYSVSSPRRRNHVVGTKSFLKNEIRKFQSEKEFKEYLEKSESETEGVTTLSMSDSFSNPKESAVGDLSTGMGLRGPSVSELKSDTDRVSNTNVQVLGIDEPDIVKTDGKKIYFSQTGFSDIRPLSDPEVGGIEEKIGISPLPQRENNQVKIINSFPPSDISVAGQIEKNGNLLLHKDMLVVFSGQTIYGYNVTDPKVPKKLWDIELKNNSQLTGARLYGDKVYIVIQEYINTSRPCPMEPLMVNGSAYPIRCDMVYYPGVPIDADVTFTAAAIDARSGKISETNSFIGSSGSSILYMSESALYITYSYSGDLVEYTHRFFQENSDLFPAAIVEKIAKLRDYDISMGSKLNELGIIISRYQSSLTDDERLKLENETENRLKDYEKKHSRELHRTGIVKLDVDNLALQGNGSVPGTLLNQFSIDEHDNYLRVAVTIGGGWISAIGGVLESTNDVYVLDKDLNETGSIKDLGEKERIYSIRFIGERGYVVTFKQVDPFFVLDLLNPKNPQVKGELKIPGYSSYLHPLGKDRILGIGKEDNKVKLSLFDVSNPQNPIEKSKYSLDEYWSEVLNTQYAFLQDEKHGVFFMPGGKGAYIFSYKNDELKLSKAVSEVQAKRALYINDYLYIIGNDKIVVLNENDWERVNQLEL